MKARKEIIISVMNSSKLASSIASRDLRIRFKVISFLRLVIILCLFLSNYSLQVVFAVFPTLPAESVRFDDTCYESTCCGDEVLYLTSPNTDWTVLERIVIEDDFFYSYRHSTYDIGSATGNYNCHAYVFGNYGWSADPSNWEGDEYPCYYEDASDGDVGRWGSHSANCITPYPAEPLDPECINCNVFFRSKCGDGPVSDHCYCVYGVPSTYWKQHEE